MHGLLENEVAEVVALFDEWAEIDRSHRKLAHRGSYLGRVWVSPASVRRVLAAHGLVLRAPRRTGTSTKTPWPDWLTYAPNEMWIYDTTQFTATKGISVSVVEDMISRKWIDTIVSAEETSTQIQVLFTNALELEELLEAVEARLDDPIDITVDDDARPILLAVSDNGAQMTSGSTREFMALCAIAQHFGRPGTPTRPGLDRDAVRAHQGRVPAPRQDHRRRGPARRARTDPRALQRGAPPRRYRLRHPKRRTRRSRSCDPRCA